MTTGDLDHSHFLEQLTRLTGEHYTAAALVLARPRWGLGALATIAVAWEIIFPWYRSLDALRARLLCLTEAGEVEEWLLISAPAHGVSPPAQEHFVSRLSSTSLRAGRVGIATVRASWGETKGRVFRRQMRAFRTVASGRAGRSTKA